MIKKGLKKFLKRKMKDVPPLTSSDNRIVTSKELKKDEIKISAVQREIQLVKSVEEYAKRMEMYVKNAVDLDSDLIAFPEYNIFDLFGLLPGFQQLNERLNSNAKNVASNVNEREYLMHLFHSKEMFLSNGRWRERMLRKLVRWL